ncbi:MAG TPA: YccF domain-containing protein [Planctomycetaceae bacterium]|nr:YccF domain-containing protein [Planctomycetaceae bacterium]
MSLLGNIIWLICGGFIAGVIHILGGITLCLTIIGIPFGYQEIKIGIATFAPFGTTLVEYEDANSPLMLVLNIIWVVTFGWVIALHHLIWTVLLGLTVIGIPFALQHLKLVPLALLPFGRDLVRGPIYRQDEWVDPQYAHSALRMR